MNSFLSPQVINYGHFLFRYRNYLFPLILCLLFLIFPPRPALGMPTLDVYMDITGILVIIAGQIIRAAVIGLVYIKRGGVNKKIHADSLVTSGIFAHCRNPLYVGNLAILTGFLIIHNNPWVYLAGGAFFLFSYHAIVCAEETFLKEKFEKEFDIYCSNVNRWLINFTNLRDTLASMKFNWKRVLIKDYTTMLTWILTIILLLTIEHFNMYGLVFNETFSLEISITLVITLSAFCVVRILKKSGALSE